MSRANIIGVGLSFLVAIYAVMMEPVGLPTWGLVVLAMTVGFYWAFGRQFFFPGDCAADTSDVKRR